MILKIWIREVSTAWTPAVLLRALVCLVCLCQHWHKELLNHPCFQGENWKCQHQWLLKAGAEQKGQGREWNRHLHPWGLVQPDHRALLHEYFKNSHLFYMPLVRGTTGSVLWDTRTALNQPICERRLFLSVCEEFTPVIFGNSTSKIYILFAPLPLQSSAGVLQHPLKYKGNICCAL